jgi:cytochrome c-type protein NapB
VSANGGPAGWPMWVFLIGSATAAVTAAFVAGERVVARRTATPAAVPVAAAAPRGEPIAAEAEVFRTRTGALAIEPTVDRARAAHPRTLATFRVLRAYPGAPPRIPHGLTPNEFRTGGCKTCHERGGYSLRFEAYVPVTPHPEMGACLQCHVGDATVMAIPLPNLEPSARCHQCHAAGGKPKPDTTLNWAPAAWPVLPRIERGQTPPPIPHDLRRRGNCLTCHAGPSGVAELRTRHPERVNCRQCHVAAGAADVPFVRPAAGAGDRARSAP